MSAGLASRLAGVAVLLAVASGCGGSADEDGDAGAQARDVVRELRSLEEGEILIQGTSPRVYGPYSLEPGGYVLRFEQRGSEDATRLVVALESKPGSRAAPYRRLVDSQDRTGTRRVTMSGKLYVHVVTAEAGYEVRLTPNRP